jgi:hypothetical protein
VDAIIAWTIRVTAFDAKTTCLFHSSNVFNTASNFFGYNIKSANGVGLPAKARKTARFSTRVAIRNNTDRTGRF